jgi:phosphatidylinositol alpha-mannosyltransferase
MKIALAIDDSLDSSDGVQQYVLAIGAWLTTQGHEVHYLTGETVRTDLNHLHSLSKNVKVRFNGNRLSVPLPTNRKMLSELLEREKFDVLHVQMPFSPFFVGRLIKAAPADTRVIASFHILMLGRMQNVGAHLLSWWTRRAQKRLDQVLSVSEPAQAFAQELGLQSTVLPNVITTKDFSGAKPFKEYKDKFTVVFLGRLVPRKGCSVLLEAIKAWKDAPANLAVLICGGGPDGEKLKAWVEANGLSSVVKFTGFVSEQEKAQYLASADIAVFPSLGGESFGIVLLEAMAAGAGVTLGGDNPGYHSVLAPIPQSLFAPELVVLMKRLKLLQQDSGLARRLHNEQQEHVKQFDVAVVGKKLLLCYQGKYEVI